MINILNKKIYLITDRAITYSDSVSRYILDLYKGLEMSGHDVTIYSTIEARLKTNELGNLKVKLVNGLPNPNDDAIFHFHLTFSIRKHTSFLIENAEILKKKAIVIFHTDTRYAEAMGQQVNIPVILEPLIKNGILGYVFSNYSKNNFAKYGFNKMFVLYPGLDLSVYEKYHNIDKKNQVLFMASNPDNKFVSEIKGEYLIDQIMSELQGFEVVSLSNVPFSEVMNRMAESKFYLALGNYEHYGFAIIEAFNLGTIPIYNNAGGLVESVHGRGFPFFESGKKVLGISNIEYNLDLVSSNFAYTKVVHNLKNHVVNIVSLYKLLEKNNE